MVKNPPRPPIKPRPNPEARWLTEMRLRYEQRQSDVAKIFDIHPGRVSEWETGIHPIPDQVMRTLRAYFRNLETPDSRNRKRRRPM